MNREGFSLDKSRKLFVQTPHPTQYETRPFINKRSNLLPSLERPTNFSFQVQQITLFLWACIITCPSSPNRAGFNHLPTGSHVSVPLPLPAPTYRNTLPWRWRQQSPPKRWYHTATLHGITTHKNSNLHRCDVLDRQTDRQTHNSRPHYDAWFHSWVI
jgi:hypothetical protein